MRVLVASAPLFAVAALAGCSSGSSGGAAPAASHFPPSSFAQLAADGSIRATYQQIETAPIGVRGCTGDRVVITVPDRATRREITAAMARVYVQHGMDDAGTAVVFAYYNARDSGRRPYTAGRLQVDSPCDGTTPRMVEVNVGDSLAGHTTTRITR